METRWRNSKINPRFTHYAKNAERQARKKSENTQIKPEVYQDYIDIKKNSNKWDSFHQPLFRNIGLCISLLLAIVAFNWKTYDDGGLMDLGELDADVDEILEIPISEQPPPPPPKRTPEVFAIKEVEDTEIIEEIEVNLDIEITEETQIEEVVFTEMEEEEEEEAETIFTIVEQQAEPVGGMSAFNKYVATNLRYPESAERLGVTGMVFVKFVVEKDGSITNVEVIRGIGAGCDEEALRVIENAPKWHPGKQRGMPVRVQRIIPLRFILIQ